MCKKLIYLVSFVFGLGLILTSIADAADPNLVGWWKLDETSGLTAVDSSVLGNDGTLPDMTGNEWTNGIVGGALEFDGTNDYVSVPNSSSLQLTSALTMAGWIKADSWDSGTDVDIIARKGEGNPNNYQLAIADGLATLYLDDGDGSGYRGDTLLNTGQWYHVAATWDGSTVRVYVDGVLDNDPPDLHGNNISTDTRAFYIGGRSGTDLLDGILDDIRIYNRALSEAEIKNLVTHSKAWNPSPTDGILYEDTWASLSWSPGDFALSHDVYFGDNFDDVNDGAESTFQGNQASAFFVVGFPGMPFPDGLVPGTTYYWRVDDVEADGTTIHKGNVWSFSVPPRTAYAPDPADGAELVEPGVELSWTGGFGTKLHYVYFGDSFDDVNSAAGGLPLGLTTYTPGLLKLAKTYYWRVDEFDAVNTYKGEVWSFTTEGGVGSPDPAIGAVDVKQTPVFTWSPGVYSASHQVYFGDDQEAVRNADTGSPEYKGTGDLGAQSYEPGKLELDVTYYWRIDEVNNVNPDSPWVGPVWSFTTANFVIVDDFEDYDVGNNEIWWAWKDGFGYASHPTLPDYPGNGTGSMVGDENTASYTEETIVHGGNQSMPLFYDNNQQLKAKYSEAELTLTYPRDWTENGVSTLSIWFRGNPAGFIEEPAGTYTMSASGVDIWNQSDEFRYAYKQLSGDGEISAQVLSVQNTDPWAKAGVMIRETLDPGSEYAFVCVTPGNGCRFQARLATGADAVSDTDIVTPEQTAITAPSWVKLERDAAGNFNGYYSSDGISWQAMSWNPQRISMPPNVCIGLALTSHNVNAVCEAGFSNVQTTGTVTPVIWTHEAIGAAMASNDAEPMYVALNGNAVVYHGNPNAALIDEWTQWNIDLQAFADQGVNLANVNTIALGLGDKSNPQAGGSGVMYFDDIRLYRPAEPAP